MSMNPKACYVIFGEVTLPSIIFESQICASDLIPWNLFSILNDLQICMSSVVHPQSRLAATVLAKARLSFCALEN
jgi:hypothetical protein